MKENIIEITEEVTIGDYVLEVGDKVKLPEMETGEHDQYMCKDCKKLFTISKPEPVVCPNCGSTNTEIYT